MACVYWIHLPEHKDLFKEGYVGVTNGEASARFKAHVRQSFCKSGKRFTINNVIRKYKDELVVTTICICDEQYSLWLEKQLRPSPEIGWNLATGGESRPGRFRHSKESKQLMRLLKTGRKLSDEHKAAIGKASTNNIKRKIAYFKKNPQLWKFAGILFNLFMDGLGYCSAETKLDLKQSSTRHIFDWFKRGWNPFEDEDWLQIFKEQRIAA